MHHTSFAAFGLVLGGLIVGGLAFASEAPPTAMQGGGYKHHHGGMGPTHIEGHNGSDYMVDPVGGDVDTMDDGPGDAPDGFNDILDATDGDDLDVMVGGIEDTFKGDPGDTVVILSQPDEEGNVTVLFKGSLELWNAILELIKKWGTWSPFEADSAGLPPSTL